MPRVHIRNVQLTAQRKKNQAAQYTVWVGGEYGMQKTYKPRSNTDVKTIEKVSHV
jgi:sulfite reductase beta subunit-like hemoprotein